MAEVNAAAHNLLSILAANPKPGIYQFICTMVMASIPKNADPVQPESKNGPDGDNDIVERIEMNVKKQNTDQAVGTTDCTDSKEMDDFNDFVVIDSDKDKSDEEASGEIEVFHLKE